MSILSGSPPIIVAGVGMTTPCGGTWGETWENVSAGISGIREISRFDPGNIGVHAAAAINFEVSLVEGVSTFLPGSKRWREVLALNALCEAMDLAQLNHKSAGSDVRVGVFTGCEKEATDDFRAFQMTDGSAFSDHADHLAELDERNADFVMRCVANTLDGVVMAANYSMACAASAIALIQAVRWLRRGAIDRAIVIGANTPINTKNVHGFHLLGALSTSDEDAETVCRPFDIDRDGFVLGEGAGALILETAVLNSARGGPSHGMIAGVGITNNCSHITSTPPEGEAAARAMTLAIEDAGLSPAQIGYINVHATSTPVGDLGEARGIKRVFENPPPVSATKSTTGHLVAAAGIVEAGITLAALKNQFVPPTKNLVRMRIRICAFQ